MNAKSFGEIIKERRIELGYTQTELAKVLEVSQQHYSNWENEVWLPSAKNVKKLSNLLKIESSVLVNAIALELANRLV